VARRRADADRLDFLRRSVEVVDRYLYPGQQAAYTIQTNGIGSCAMSAALGSCNSSQ
jgi:hypothetical protein